MIYIDEERCTGCGTCVAVCPAGALRVSDGVAHIDQEECIECEVCLSACPETAILSVSEGVLVEKEPVASVKTDPRRSADAPRGAKVAPWVGAALAFVGREIVPRLVNQLLDSLVRRDSRDSRPTTDSTSEIAGRSNGGRRRFRRRQGQS